MSEITLENSRVLRGKLTSLKAPDKTLSQEGVAADAKAVGDAIQEAVTGIPSGGASSLFGHVGSMDNPHRVTKDQLGLGNVDNTSDLDKPVSKAQQAAMDAIGNGVVGTVNEHTEALKTVLHTTGGDMTGAINMNGQPISGLNAPTEGTQAANKGYVDGVVRKAAPRNLLDNSDFRNLVAQAGIGGNHGSVAYAADRWILDSGTVSYTAGTGLMLNGTLRQKLENAPAAAYPYIGMASGTATIRYENGAVTITSSGGVIKWAALYEGEYTAETLPEYQPKGYGVELAECQRYYYKCKSGAFIPLINNANTIGSYLYRLTVYLPTVMRVAPTVTVAPPADPGYVTGKPIVYVDSILFYANSNKTSDIVNVNGFEASADL